MLKQWAHYKQVKDSFFWDIPVHYNIGVDICDRWAEKDPERIAIIDVSEDGEAVNYDFMTLKWRSNQLANALQARGITRQPDQIADRVGVLLPQCVQTAVAHIAIIKMGCVSIPLFTLFGRDALLHRLKDSGAKAVITNNAGAKALSTLTKDLPGLKCIISVDGTDAIAEDFDAVCAEQSVSFSPVDTLAEDPALLIYTSGTTGNPKGALHANRVLLGHLPGVEISHNFLPQKNDKFWTPADWAWIGGLLDVLMPALHHGIPVVARRFSKFSANAAFELIKQQGIRNAFLPPTALKAMRLVPGAEQMGISMRSVASGGEPLGAELIDWGQKVFGAVINEFYGQTECNMVVSSCSALEPATPGVMGRPVPGHTVDVIDEATGEVREIGREGEIAVLSPDPVMFLQYWNNPQATQEKFVNGPDGRWLLTGDQGVRDRDGKIQFMGRNDDIIGSAGYRIGPAEVEDCLISHPAVHLAGVVGKPDKLRGSIIAAYVTLTAGYEASDRLADEIANYVKSRLAAHEYPRMVRFIDQMPMTVTGKIIRAKLRDRAAAEATSEAEANAQ